MGHDRHTVAVFAPNLHLTVTIEPSASGGDEIHLHPGGQGFWVARMLTSLGERPLLCGPLGREPGKVVLGLLGEFGMDVSPVDIAHSSPVVVIDRRSGDRETIAQSPPPALERHEIDDLYGRFLDRSLDAVACVVTGQQTPIVPSDFYRRLGHDLDAGEVSVIADVHGAELDAILEGGPLHALKVSEEDLVADAMLAAGPKGLRAYTAAIETLSARGARSVIISRQDEPAIAKFGEVWMEARTPELEPADHRGAGDSMTAGLAAALRRRLGPVDTFRLACAAGAANVTRHGLGSADADLIPRLVEKVLVRELAVPMR